MNHVVAESMALSELAEHCLLASCTSDELKSVRQCLSLVHAGTPLSQVADGTIKMALSAVGGTGSFRRSSDGVGFDSSNGIAGRKHGR